MFSFTGMEVSVWPSWICALLVALIMLHANRALASPLSSLSSSAECSRWRSLSSSSKPITLSIDGRYQPSWIQHPVDDYQSCIISCERDYLCVAMTYEPSRNISYPLSLSIEEKWKSWNLANTNVDTGMTCQLYQLSRYQAYELTMPTSSLYHDHYMVLDRTCYDNGTRIPPPPNGIINNNFNDHQPTQVQWLTCNAWYRFKDISLRPSMYRQPETTTNVNECWSRCADDNLCKGMSGSYWSSLEGGSGGYECTQWTFDDDDSTTWNKNDWQPIRDSSMSDSFVIDRLCLTTGYTNAQLLSLKSSNNNSSAINNGTCMPWTLSQKYDMKEELDNHYYVRPSIAMASLIDCQRKCIGIDFCGAVGYVDGECYMVMASVEWQYAGPHTFDGNAMWILDRSCNNTEVLETSFFQPQHEWINGCQWQAISRHWYFVPNGNNGLLPLNYDAVMSSMESSNLLSWQRACVAHPDCNSFSFEQPLER
jgi:hypothetical protein